MRGAESTYTTNSPEETEGLGVSLAGELMAGDIVGLIGGLGTGKTRFVRGIAKGLGSKGYIKSPSFTIINIYEGGRLPLYHIDLYRIGKEDEFESSGIEEYICAAGISVIEWADKYPPILNDCGLIVKFSHKGETIRGIEIQRKEQRR